MMHLCCLVCSLFLTVSLSADSVLSYDKIVLNDGTQLTGKIITLPPLQFLFGQLPMNINDAASVAFVPSRERTKMQVITWDGYSFTCDVPSEKIGLIQYSPSQTLHHDIEPLTINYILFKKRDHTVTPRPQQLYSLELKNGDIIPVVFVEEVIQLSNGWREYTLKTEEIVDIYYDGKLHGTVESHFGKVQELGDAFLKERHLHIKIPKGSQKLSLPWDQIRRVCALHTEPEKKVPEITMPEVKQIEQEVHVRSEDVNEQLSVMKEFNVTLAECLVTTEKSLNATRRELQLQTDRHQTVYEEMQSQLMALEQQVEKANRNVVKIQDKHASLEDKLIASLETSNRLERELAERNSEFEEQSAQHLMSERVHAETQKELMAQIHNLNQILEQESLEIQQKDQILNEVHQELSDAGKKTMRLMKDNEGLHAELLRERQLLEEQRELVKRLKSTFHSQKAALNRIEKSHLDLVSELEHARSAHSDLLQEFSKDAPTGVPIAKYVHIVTEGENLNSISMKYFATPHRWADIYEANRDVIEDVNQLKVGTAIIIPD